MDFKLKRPCSNCPFRADIVFPLGRERAAEIAESLDEGTFPCHKTVDYSLDDLQDQLNEGTQHCAGAAIMRLKMGRPGRLLQIAERLGLCDLSTYDLSAPVFQSPAEFVERRSQNRAAQLEALGTDSRAQTTTHADAGDTGS